MYYAMLMGVEPMCFTLQVKEVDSSDILVACIENLKEGKSYMFRVYAENKAGAGPPTELREAVVPRSLIGEQLFLYTVTTPQARHWSTVRRSSSNRHKYFVINKLLGVCFYFYRKTCLINDVTIHKINFAVIAELIYALR